MSPCGPKLLYSPIIPLISNHRMLNADKLTETDECGSSVQYFLFLFCSLLRAAGLSHSCPTYSLNSRLPNVPLIPCTRACATVIMYQPQSPCSHRHYSCRPPPMARLPPFSTFIHTFPIYIGFFLSEAAIPKPPFQSCLPPSFPSNTPSHSILISPSPPHPTPPQPISSFNLLLTTWRGIASFSPPTASPKPPDLRLGLIWTLYHPVSIHLPHSLIQSSPPPSLPKRLWFKILYCEHHTPLAVSFRLLPTATFPPAPQHQPIPKRTLSPSDVGLKKRNRKCQKKISTL